MCTHARTSERVAAARPHLIAHRTHASTLASGVCMLSWHTVQGHARARHGRARFGRPHTQHTGARERAHTSLANKSTRCNATTALGMSPPSPRNYECPRAVANAAADDDSASASASARAPRVSLVSRAHQECLGKLEKIAIFQRRAAPRKPVALFMRARACHPSTRHQNDRTAPHRPFLICMSKSRRRRARMHANPRPTGRTSIKACATAE